MVSNITETTIKIAVPPMVRAANPVIALIPKGRTAINPKNSAPIKVRRFKILYKYSVVEPPGLMPGIKAPCFWRFFEIASGSNVTAV